MKGKFSSVEDVSQKRLLVPERIDFAVLKTTLKGLLNERMPSNFQTATKKRNEN